jgi:hypothetical protein
MTEPEFCRRLREELAAGRLLGDQAAREVCAARARELGDRTLDAVRVLAGPATMRVALSVRRGPGFAETYRYVAGYGRLMTEFLTAPVPVDDLQRERVAHLGGIANLIVSHFDELVDGGWPRALLLPGWALLIAPTRAGRLVMRVTAIFAPAPMRLILRLVAEYFRCVAELPYVVLRAEAHRDLRRSIVAMYLEEGRTPREFRRLRGRAARQKKTALPLVVLGLPVWLAGREFAPEQYARHRRWLVRIGKFIRWIDDAADLAADDAAGSANMVRRALGRSGRTAHTDALLAAGVARRGRRLLGEWRELAGFAGSDESAAEVALHTVLAATLVAWIGVPRTFAND